MAPERTETETVEKMTLQKAAARLNAKLVRAWLLLGLVVVCLVVQPDTLSSTSLSAMLPFASILAIAAVGQGFTIQQRGIDFSVAGVISLTGVIVTRYPGGDSGRLVVAIGLALGAAAVVGLVNGLAITRLRITPIVATLAVNAILLGVIQTYAGGVPEGATHNLSAFAVNKTLGIPNTALLAAAAVLISAFVVGRTVIGRRFTAISASPAAGKASGLRVDRYLVIAYVVAALCYGTAGVVLAGYLQSPGTEVGNPYLLATIAAVVIGGTSLGGGRGQVLGTGLAALFLTQLNALIAALGWPASSQFLVQSGAIAIAAGGHRFVAAGWRRRRGRRSPPKVHSTMWSE